MVPLCGWPLFPFLKLPAHWKPSRGGKQWKDRRSAKELAKAWFRTREPKVPEEFELLFKSHPSTDPDWQSNNEPSVNVDSASNKQ
jgi:hypothetical protein